MRPRSPKTVVDEIEDLVHNHGVKQITFADNVFNIPQEHAEEICEEMIRRDFDITPGVHPICPIMLGDAVLATRMADAMLARGIYVIAFSYPVVPKGKARIRVQLSAVHQRDDLQFAMEAFSTVKEELGI